MDLNNITNKIHNSDCIEFMKKMPENSVSAIITDPPYHLTSIVKRFGKDNSAPAKFGTDGAFKRASKGFMGKTWDGGDIAFRTEVWNECLRVLKPGGHLLSFGGDRTHHRMMVAIEDAGFDIRTTICWAFGSGFPKSHNIGKNIEKIKVGGIKNLKQIGTKKGIKVETGTQGYSYNKEYVAGKCMGGKQINGDIPVYEINNEWDGWGTALKPAVEFICMARKPLSERTIALNVLKWGTGGININESRIPAQSKEQPHKQRNSGILAGGGRNLEEKYDKAKFPEGDYGKSNFRNNERQADKNPNSRFPANLILDGSEEVIKLFPNTKSGKMTSKHTRHTDKSPNEIYGKFDINHPLSETFGDKGSSARFFYCAKANRSERLFSNHPTQKPVALCEYLIKLITSKNGIVLDPFLGSGTTAVASINLKRKFIGIEQSKEYCKIAQARINHAIKIQKSKLF